MSFWRPHLGVERDVVVFEDGLAVDFVADELCRRGLPLLR
jgi:hypothetical protein